MRQIVFLKLEESNPVLWEALLELCSRYTPLVEPFEDNCVYIDLSGCGNALPIVRAISSSICEHNGQTKLRAGLATSRLLARITAQTTYLPCCPTNSYRPISEPGIYLVEVLAGGEKEFIHNLPLADLYVLSPRAVKKLSRLGFRTIGELASLSAGQLAQLTAENPHLLIQHINGIDPSPVSGLYPPSRITYPLELEEGINDRVRIEEKLKSAAAKLELLLEERHASCRHISLEMRPVRLRPAPPIKERQLSSHCYKAGQLLNIFLSLFPWEYVGQDSSGFQISLQDLSILSLCQPDLFLYRILLDKRERENLMEAVMHNLQGRFPCYLQQGLEINRREQVLALWDPWRRLTSTRI